MHPSRDITSNLQQPAQCPEPQLVQILCVYHGVVPPAPNPEPHTAVLGECLWHSQSPPTTIHNATKMVESEQTFVQLPPPAPDPVNMVSTGEPSGPQLAQHGKQPPLRKVQDQTHGCTTP